MKILKTQIGDFGPFNSVERLTDRWNCDGIEFQFSVVGDSTEASYTPSEAPEVIVVPEKVTRRQGLQQLYLEGITLDMILAAVDTIPDTNQRALARIEVMESLEFERKRPIISMMWTALGKDIADLDGVFIKASKLS